ncbi:MAG: elongation factor Ts [Patescibacteria group bacterium]|nr:elongation factor Ts [Patescibacteria group bacterium]
MIDKIKQLRQETGVSLSLCKKALEETGGEAEKAKELLRKWGQDLAGKRGGRDTREGVVASYIHANKKIGVLVDLRCETDFVARNEDFQALAHEIALHIAALNPLYVSSEDIPEEIIEKEKEIYREQMMKENKPKDVMQKIIEGKIEKFKKGVCLTHQAYIKDDAKTIQDLVNETISKLGENIGIGQFTRIEI